MQGLKFFPLFSQESLKLLAGIFLGFIFAYLITDAFMARKTVKGTVDYPLVGSPVSFMPLLVHNLQYLLRAGNVVQDGYSKFKNKAFQLLRHEGRVVVLPHTLLNELAALPETIASLQPALSIDLSGYYTGLDWAIKTKLNNIIIQRRLTPRLPSLIPQMEETTRTNLDALFPKSDEWTEIEPFHLLERISAGLVANAIVGPSLRDDPAWVDISLKYTKNVFITSMILRLFPCWMRSIIHVFLPSYWVTRGCFRSARHILGSKIQRLIELHDSGTWEPNEDDADESTVLGWLCEMAKGDDRNPDTISHLLVILVLASVHNTLFRIITVLYDVTAAGPELNDQLVAEIAATMKEGWKDMPYDRLYRLDSVMSESQRMSPPSLLGMKRLFKSPYTFQDGTHVAAGTYTCMATSAIENDSANTPEPETFNGLRRFHALESKRGVGPFNEAMVRESSFSTPTPTALNWGYGKSACPGRHFATCVIKMVLVKLLAEYDFAFCPGTGRPKNMTVYDFTFIFPGQKLLTRPKQRPLHPF